MRRIVRVTGANTSPWVPVDHNSLPFEVSFAAVVSGGGSYSIEHTYDNVLDAAAITAGIAAFPNASVTAQTANKEGSYAAPIAAMRVVNTVGGTVTLTVLQGVKG